VTKEELLNEFPDYKPTVYTAPIEDDYIYPIFTYYDRIELEERLLEKRNKEKQQMELFLN
jgi:hypothetical protein